MRLGVIVLSALVALAVVVPATAGPATRSSTPVWSFADLSVVGTSSLTRLDGGVQMTLQTSGLPAGKVVTVVGHLQSSRVLPVR